VDIIIQRWKQIEASASQVDLIELRGVDAVTKLELHFEMKLELFCNSSALYRLSLDVSD